MSWHAFLVGAFDPSARVAIDKPPVDLWLQVAGDASSSASATVGARCCPAALGGTLAVVALYDLLRTLAGRRAALVGALALAVLPVAVITARSDTMDSVMAALLVAAVAVAARGLRTGRVRHVACGRRCSERPSRSSSSRRCIAALPLALHVVARGRASRRRRLAASASAAWRAASPSVSPGWSP